MSSSSPATQANYYNVRKFAAGGFPQYTQSGNRSSSTSLRFFQDGVFAIAETAADSGALPTHAWASGALADSASTVSEYSFFTETFSTIGGSMSDAKHALLNTIAIEYNSTVIPGGRLEF